MINSKSYETFLFFAKAYPARGIFMIFALLVAGVLEGVGIMALLPLVAILTEQTGVQSGMISEFMGRIFDVLHLEMSVGPILLFITILIASKSLITMLAMMQVSYSSSHVCTDLRLSYLRHVLKSNWQHFISIKSGASANALGSEALRATYAFMHGCYMLSWGIQVVVYAIIAFLISWSLTLSAVFAGGVMVLVLSVFVRIARKSGKEQTTILDAVLARITDTLYGAKPLKAMGKGDNLLSMMEQDTIKLQAAQRNTDIARHAVRVLSEPIMITFIVMGLYAILTFGDLPVAELLFLSLLFLRMVTKISAVQSAYLSMATNESALWSLQSKINAAKKSADCNQGVLEAVLKEGVQFKNISFSYGDQLIIDDLSLKIPATGFHVIFGPSGEGKTTLLDLMIGLHQPNSGEVLIDGQSLTNIKMESWRHKIGYVPQDVLLFHDSVINNVTLSDASITREDVIISLKTAGALAFVEAMENGLETIVGERGSKLSGGQRQRIAIARAIVARPSLLILDEATSALDIETEKSLLKTVKLLSKETLVLAVSHNPASLTMADSVFKLQNSQLKKLSASEINGLNV